MKDNYKGLFIVVGANPFRPYGSAMVTFTDINVIGVFNDKEDADTCAEGNYNKCGGLLLVIDVDKTKVESKL